MQQSTLFETLDFCGVQFVESYSAMHSVNMVILCICRISQYGTVQYCALSAFSP